MKKLSSSQLQMNQQQQRKSTRQKLKNNRISDIIQRSILYSDVNYQFKGANIITWIRHQKIGGFLFTLSFPVNTVPVYEHVNVAKKKIETQAAITIQKHFRGYIQRKYIQEARYIIDCIKKIQRFWKICLHKCMNGEVMFNLFCSQNLNLVERRGFFYVFVKLFTLICC